MRHYAVSALGCLMHMERVVSADKTLQNMLRLCNIFRDVVIQLTLFYFFLQDNLIFFFPSCLHIWKGVFTQEVPQGPSLVLELKIHLRIFKIL